MDVYDAIKGRRTIRRFSGAPVGIRLLTRLVDAARLAPSGGNCQPLEFIAVSKPELVAKLASHVKWAAYIHPAGNPPDGRGPGAFIVTLVNRQIAPDGAPYDVAAAVMTMILAARAEGLGSCWMGNIDRPALAKVLNVPGDGWILDSVLALGIPGESPVTEPLRDSVRYWKDDAGVLHVPKRLLEDILHEETF
ncbi:MAG: nitroreductase family protein [Candidatus Glassbacteria bacterium]|nr:nitroreductase family protein [Candidatus Glassbacteria bacterium]